MPIHALLSVTVHPFVVQVGPLPAITGFGLAMLLSFLIAQMVCTTELARRGHDAAAEGMADVTVGAVVGGLLGAKIYYAILFHETLFSRGGFVFWGGLVGGILATYGVIQYKKLGFARISDVAGIGIAAAYAVGRTGCWAVGDDYGRPWDGALGVKFPEGTPASTVANLIGNFRDSTLAGRPMTDVVAVFPTQLLEVSLGLVMFFILWRNRAHKHREGWLFGLYCILAGGERFIAEFFRSKDDRFFGGLTLAQMIAVVFMMGGAAWMAMRRAEAEPATR
ncbi:MAG: prolipoprotein diacylglyceryl transferase [Gemmatimonadetes bacterium]|nr:prolipoprotein diacylglyceryl transferase [Gemmatimonadota bacterium]MBI3567739.1 prolipoprotein diacylglyceryl transferase [Gemmatimonadota bacterium]